MTRAPQQPLSLKDRIAAVCALIGIWGSAVLKYFDDTERSGLTDYSELIELLEIAELSEVLALPLLALGVAGSGRVFWTVYHSMPGRSRLARSGILPRRR